MNDTDGDLYRLRPSLAKIGKRYYWTLEQAGVRVVDGFAATREDATTALVR